MRKVEKKNRLMHRLMGIFFLFWMVTEASATPLLISVDMDPFTAGIQNTLTVTEGASFQIDIRVREIPSIVPIFSDFMQMIISFNDNGLLLTGGALTWGAGGLATTFPLTNDFFTSLPPNPGTNQVGRVGATSAPGYASNSGQFSLFPPVLAPFSNFNGADDSGPLISLILNSQVGNIGSSSIFAHGLVNTPIGDRTPFTFLGVNVPTISNIGTVKVVGKPVIPSTIPNPTTVLLLLSGLIALVGFRRQKRA